MCCLFLFLSWCAVCLWLLLYAYFWDCFLWLQKWIIKPPIKIFHFYRPGCVVVVTACHFWCFPFCHFIIKHEKYLPFFFFFFLAGNYIQGTELENEPHVQLHSVIFFDSLSGSRDLQVSTLPFTGQFVTKGFLSFFLFFYLLPTLTAKLWPHKDARSPT